MRLRILAAALAAVATASITTPAHAQTPPPHASTCTATVTGVRVPGSDLGLVETDEVAVVKAVVVCEALGLLTTAPADYLPLYAGAVTVGTTVGNGLEGGCVGGPNDEARGLFTPSVGPTLVMTGFAVCSWDDTANRRPVVYWSTHDLDSVSGNYSVSGHEGTWLAL